jgi:hypothetical protein
LLRDDNSFLSENSKTIFTLCIEKEDSGISVYRTRNNVKSELIFKTDFSELVLINDMIDLFLEERISEEKINELKAKINAMEFEIETLRDELYELINR